MAAKQCVFQPLLLLALLVLAATSSSAYFDQCQVPRLDQEFCNSFYSVCLASPNKLCLAQSMSQCLGNTGFPSNILYSIRTYLIRFIQRWVILTEPPTVGGSEVPPPTPQLPPISIPPPPPQPPPPQPQPQPQPIFIIPPSPAAPPPPPPPPPPQPQPQPPPISIMPPSPAVRPSRPPLQPTQQPQLPVFIIPPSPVAPPPPPPPSPRPRPPQLIIQLPPQSQKPLPPPPPKLPPSQPPFIFFPHQPLKPSVPDISLPPFQSNNSSRPIYNPAWPPQMGSSLITIYQTGNDYLDYFISLLLSLPEQQIQNIIGLMFSELRGGAIGQDINVQDINVLLVKLKYLLQQYSFKEFDVSYLDTYLQYLLSSNTSLFNWFSILLDQIYAELNIPLPSGWPSVFPSFTLEGVFSTNLAYRQSLEHCNGASASEAVCERYCTSDYGGNWIALQYRERDMERPGTFDKTLNEYIRGFGDYQTGYWMGLACLSDITNKFKMELLVELADASGVTALAHYDDFRVGSEAEGYPLLLGTFLSGAAGDGLRSAEGRPFTTRDEDRDQFRKNCAVKHKGGWWYANCQQTSVKNYLNGYFSRDSSGHDLTANFPHFGVRWQTFDTTYVLVSTRMFMRRASGDREKGFLDYEYGTPVVYPQGLQVVGGEMGGGGDPSAGAYSAGGLAYDLAYGGGGEEYEVTYGGGLGTSREAFSGGGETYGVTFGGGGETSGGAYSGGEQAYELTFGGGEETSGMTFSGDTSGGAYSGGGETYELMYGGGENTFGGQFSGGGETYELAYGGRGDTSGGLAYGGGGDTSGGLAYGGGGETYEMTYGSDAGVSLGGGEEALK